MRLLVKLALTSCLLFLMSCTEENTHVTQIVGPSDWRGPEIHWLSPPESEVRGTVGLDAEVTDSSALSRIVLFVNGAERDTLFTSPCRFELVTDSLTDGVHVCEIRAWDIFGNLGISPVLRINVMNSVAQEPRLLWVPDDFIAIQTAINAAQDFDTIRVRDGTYYETLNTFGKGIWIESEHGPIWCILNAQGGHNVIFVPTCPIRTTIRGFQIVGGSFILSEFEDGAYFEFCNNIVVSDTVEALLHASRTGGCIRNNFFKGANECVVIWSLLGTVNNNIFQDAITAAMWNSNYGMNPVLCDYNLFWQNQLNYYGFNPGLHDLYGDPLIDLQNGELLEGSPCFNSGSPEIFDLDSSRSDIGPFGGPLAYW